MENKLEIIVRFKNEKIKNEFIGQMMDGFGENECDFSHWHKDGDDYVKKYDNDGRLICTVNKIFEDEF